MFYVSLSPVFYISLPTALYAFLSPVFYSLCLVLFFHLNLSPSKLAVYWMVSLGCQQVQL